MAPVKALGPRPPWRAATSGSAPRSRRRGRLQPIADGDVMAISISEPGAGSDVGHLLQRQGRSDGGYVINGQKTWCSYAHIAGRILLVARTSREEIPARMA